MIKETIDTFKHLFNKEGLNLICDNLVLKKGTYVLVDIKENTYQMFNTGEKEDKVDRDLYKYVAKLDYLSNLLNMNKPVDSKKTIHSNNYMSFFLKKNHVVSKDDNNKRDSKNQSKEHQLVLNCVDRYFDAIENIVPDKDSTKKADVELLEMFKSLDEPLQPIDKVALEKNRRWIKDNILLLKEDSNYRDDDNYLKIFFDDTEERYLNESNRYLIPKLFNSNAYNTCIGETLYGLPNDNMQLNSNKPSLKASTRKNSCPILIDIESALLQKRYFDYLTNFAVSGHRCVYVDENGFYTKEEFDNLDRMFNGYLLILQRGMSLDITDFKVIMGVHTSKAQYPLKFVNALGVNLGEELNSRYDYFDNISDIEDLINEVLFYKRLKTSYFNDDIKLNNKSLEKALRLSKKKLFDWFYCGKEKEGYLTLRRIWLDVVKNSIFEGNIIRAKWQMNLMCSLSESFKESRGMVNLFEEIRRGLIEKINTQEERYIESDTEYFYAVGQLAAYLISLKNSKKINQSDINSILNAKTDIRLKQEFERLYKKYNHALDIRYKKFKRLYFMVVTYTPQSKQSNSTEVLAGFLSNSIIWEKVNRESEKNEEQDS